MRVEGSPYGQLRVTTVGSDCVEPVIDELVEFLLCPGSRAVASERIEHKHFGFGNALENLAEWHRVIGSIA